MTSDRWRRIEELYHAALARSAADRAAFLAAACAGDEELRRDVESLLASDERAEALLAESAMHAAAANAATLVGRQLGAYRVIAAIGAGGMGEVYRARDTALGRDVALKLLPADVVHDPERVARFRREAQLLASLSHANIAQIHGFAESDGAQFLVLELVDGETLAQRLARGRLTIAQAVDVARQIAAGLEAAHEKSIVHRDLKPANIAFAADGTVKLLDFGIAKAVDADAATHATEAPGVVTDVGVILGTAAYMSPEQATGRPADKRSDIWAFGCVLYEMLTGRVAFAGDTVSDTIAAILAREVDWSALPASTPAHVRRVLERALRKDPKQRLHDIADARIELEEPTHPSTDTQAVRAKQWSTAAIVSVSVAGLALAAIGALVGARIGGSKSDAPATRIALSLSADNSLTLDGGIAISQDGQSVAFAARSSEGRYLYVRRLDEWQPRRVAQLSSAVAQTRAFFSPDASWIAFLDRERLVKVPVSGGRPQTICDCHAVENAGVWLPDGTIVFVRAYSSKGVWRIPSDGGNPEAVVRPAGDGMDSGDVWYDWPRPLPNDRGLLLTVRRGSQASIAAWIRGEQRPRPLIASGYAAIYVPSGHLLYNSEGQLHAVPFDAERLAVRGADAVVVDDVTDDANFDVSANGTLIYFPRRLSLESLVWKDRQGVSTPSGLNPRRYTSAPRLSPDGRRVAITVVDGGARNVWVGSVDREPLTRLTFGNNDVSGPWTPDGRGVVFASGAQGPFNLFLAAADGSTPSKRLTSDPKAQAPTSVSPDGDVVFYNEIEPSTGIVHIGRVSIKGREMGRLAGTRSNESIGKLSPDGRWLAYTSDESGTDETYVRAYPGPGLKVQVSVGGGDAARWRGDGGELFYRAPTAVMAVPVLDLQTFRAGAPVRLFNYTGQFDVDPSGQRFLVYEKAETGHAVSQLNVIQNWFTELKQRVPVK